LREHDVVLSAGDLRLRPMRESDWELLLRWNSDPEVLYYSEGDDVSSYTLDEVQGIYRDASQAGFCFVIEVGGLPVGECWLQRMNLERIIAEHPGLDCRRIDLLIGEKEWWGRGVGTGAIALLTDYGFTTAGADAIFGCDIADYNPRSRRAFEKAGYLSGPRRPAPPDSKARWTCDARITREEHRDRPAIGWPPAAAAAAVDRESGVPA
jgi:aminoglycoside 6'-N-acetyltransferase